MEGNAEVSRLGDGSVFFLGVYLECEIFQNVAASVLWGDSVFLLEYYLKSKTLQNAEMQK